MSLGDLVDMFMEVVIDLGEFLVCFLGIEFDILICEVDDDLNFIDVVENNISVENYKMDFE